ncbi:MAG TPA: GNAT family N-acetyltransferase [Rhizomicrobium sp.]|nr:GNAT family N-acetyltransferase [Rhizomicrobium sp.]
MVTIARDDDPAAAKLVSDGLETFNREVGRHPNPLPLNVVLRDDDGKVRGGVLAWFAHDSVYVDTVWLDEALRGRDHGSAMLAMVEDEARARGAEQVWLYTVSWQAPEFYEKRGYRVFGELPYRLRDGHKRLFFWKTL